MVAIFPARIERLSSFASRSVNFHEPTVSDAGLPVDHVSFHPGRQWPGRTEHPPITTSRHAIHVVARSLSQRKILLRIFSLI